jgi:class 3 adenylate cyclase/uncharacterized protein YaaN involved in tellurite resistance
MADFRLGLSSMSEGRVERRLAAILAADVAGYSRLMGEDEEGTLAALLAIRRELGDPKIADHRGRIVKTTGDGLLVEFASVVDAVRCAVEVQREMMARNADVPLGRRIEYRMGINVGDIIIEEGDIFGDGVNIAARLEALAEPGGICLSTAAHEQVRDRLDIAFEDLGEQHFKNIARPVRTYGIARGAPSRATTPPAAVLAPALPDNPSIAVLPFQNMSGDPETKPDVPLDLSIFDTLDPMPTAATAVVATAPTQTATAVTDPRLLPEPPQGRLVELANLGPDDLVAARQSAARIDFRQTATLLAHGDGVLAAIAQASRLLLTGVRLGDAGEVGRIAAAVIDGVKILRIEDLQAESAAGQPAARKGILGKLIGAAADAHTAFKGFAESRQKFLDLMDAEQAKARKTKADLAVSIDLLEQQAAAIRQSLYGLKIEIAAGQIALDRGQDELETLRQNAVRTGDPADAADVLEFRGVLANFRGKIAEMRENLVGSAMLIPIVGQNKKAAETRMMKISNGMLVVIPRLMAVASQAVVQVDIRRAADESERLDEAARQITLLASKGAHEAATSAARSLGGDQRNIDVLAQVADETIKTMHEVIDIEREVASGDRAREAKLTAIRDRLIAGMRGVNRHAVAP